MSCCESDRRVLRFPTGRALVAVVVPSTVALAVLTAGPLALLSLDCGPPDLMVLLLVTAVVLIAPWLPLAVLLRRQPVRLELGPASFSVVFVGWASRLAGRASLARLDAEFDQVKAVYASADGASLALWIEGRCSVVVLQSILRWTGMRELAAALEHRSAFRHSVLWGDAETWPVTDSTPGDAASGWLRTSSARHPMRLASLAFGVLAGVVIGVLLLRQDGGMWPMSIALPLVWGGLAWWLSGMAFRNRELGVRTEDAHLCVEQVIGPGTPIVPRAVRSRYAVCLPDVEWAVASAGKRGVSWVRIWSHDGHVLHIASPSGDWSGLATVVEALRRSCPGRVFVGRLWR